MEELFSSPHWLHLPPTPFPADLTTVDAPTQHDARGRRERRNQPPQLQDYRYIRRCSRRRLRYHLPRVQRAPIKIALDVKVKDEVSEGVAASSSATASTTAAVVAASTTAKAAKIRTVKAAKRSSRAAPRPQFQISDGVGNAEAEVNAVFVGGSYLSLFLRALGGAPSLLALPCLFALLPVRARTRSPPLSLLRARPFLLLHPDREPGHDEIVAASGAPGGSRFLVASLFLRFYPPFHLHDASLLATSSYTTWLRASSSASSLSSNPFPSTRVVCPSPHRVGPPLLPVPVSGPPASPLARRLHAAYRPASCRSHRLHSYIASSFQCFPSRSSPSSLSPSSCLFHPTSSPLCVRPCPPSARFAPDAARCIHVCFMRVPSSLPPSAPPSPPLTHTALQADKMKNKLTGEVQQIAQAATEATDMSSREADFATTQ
ncbi:hypothetical protein C8R44DRAFT_877593 [Mycena epipterygia]|nr:hypothetical protein C8R44DRAFT_877593 [Mycena epipterygia]